MQSYQFPLPSAHGSLVAFLLQFGRKIGLVAPAAVNDRTSRRHRMMLVVDERRVSARKRSSRSPGFGPPAVAAVSTPTYFGSFCSSLVAPRNGSHKRSVSHEGTGQDATVATRLLNA